MIVKVCGMREEANVAALLSLGVDMVGFIQYAPSPRYAPRAIEVCGAEKVAVFVDESFEHCFKVARDGGFTHLQLHGHESSEICARLRSEGFVVIKAISIATREDLAMCESYHGSVDMLLFDTKCSGYGGSGLRFDWSILDSYSGATPFLLSGGIDETMAGEILSIRHPMMVGVDLNSRFEIAPANKDIKKLEKFIKAIR